MRSGTDEYSAHALVWRRQARSASSGSRAWVGGSAVTGRGRGRTASTEEPVPTRHAFSSPPEEGVVLSGQAAFCQRNSGGRADEITRRWVLSGNLKCWTLIEKLCQSDSGADVSNNDLPEVS
jgi:hypothetical protein